MAYTTIDDPSAHFQTALYTGNGSDDYSITNDGNSDLQPDLLWFKERGGTQIHQVFDSSRGIANSLRTNDTDAENADSPNDRLTAINSDGFTLGDDGNPNTNTSAYVAWQWKANGGTTSSVSASGTTLASTHQTDSTNKFCIMTWTGSGTAGHKVTHGLGSVPKLIIMKRRDSTDSWPVYHHKNTAAPETDYLHLDETIATADSVDRWNDTAPTSTLITLGDAGAGNADGGTYVGYCWDEIQGYSKFGKYTGNGNVDGPFVYTGFKPSFLIAKETGAVRNWTMAASKMQPKGNGSVTNSHQPNIAGAQDANERMDWLSNGFKLRTISTTWNTDNGTFIYMAFAENPFVTSGGVPCTAR